ncbi:ROK family transcriptional regulator [Glutamicibacter sp.]|uniref:ROK family transcriptional regulator n=1 Tax=Glutamicibacter sp. TaxID=1931995 RepID=UPI003D6B4F9B
MNALRRANTRKILDVAWEKGPVTASELIGATGLTRATVLSLAKELVTSGWLCEAASTRHTGEYSKGRPALRYELNHVAGLIAGIDAGQHRLTLALTDLHGDEVSREEVGIDPSAGAQERTAAIGTMLKKALERHGVDQFAALVVAVPAPVDASGKSPEHPEQFWQRMNPCWSTGLRDYAHLVVVDNDANLAATAELLRGGAGSFASLLVGERLGAGIVVDGKILRGKQGFAGEMRALSYVSGVGNALGLGYQARMEAKTALAQGRVSCLSQVPANELSAVNVFDAASARDPLALEILESLGHRFAKISAVLAGFIGLESIILSGAMAQHLAPVIEIAQRELDQDPEFAGLELHISTLGADVALKGALASGRDLVRQAAPFAYSHSLEQLPDGEN